MYWKYIAVIGVFSCNSILFLPALAVAQVLPVCQSIGSDADGDGYGWENEASCIVSTQGVCEDRGDYPWGWNPVSETSCRLDLNEENSFFDEMIGTWICKNMVLTSDYYEPGVSRSGALPNDTVQWRMAGIASSNPGYFPDETQPESCHYFSGTNYPISKLELGEDGQATKHLSLGLLYLYTEDTCQPNSRVEFYNPRFGSWSISEYQPEILGESFKSIEFQSVTFEGSRYELMHLKRTDYSRYSCRRGEGLEALLSGVPDWRS